MSKLLNERYLEDMVADFDTFLLERDWDSCNAIIDNLRDMKEYEKGIELAKRLTARKMTVPSDYGKEKSPFEFLQDSHDMIFNSVREGDEQEIW